MKIFLTLCQEGSIRAAATKLDINHTTVSRRINKLELNLGKRLFERETTGYLLTRLGQEMFEDVTSISDKFHALERKLSGNDSNLSGDIRITASDTLAEHLLMPAIASFSQLYPQISIEIKDSAKLLNLVNREADVAFRVVNEPPEYLIGRRISKIHRASYIAKKYEEKMHDEQWLAQQNWIGWTDKIRRPVGVLARDYPKLDSKHKIGNSSLNFNACKQGMGVSFLPCFIGDAAPELVRVPPYTSESKFDLWLLSHPDMRKNAKVQTFVRYMTDYLMSQKPMLQGELFEKR